LENLDKACVLEKTCSTESYIILRISALCPQKIYEKIKKLRLLNLCLLLHLKAFSECMAVSFTTDQFDMYAMSIIMHLPMSEPSPIIEDPDPTAAHQENVPDLEGSLFGHIWGYELPETSLFVEY